ncbi:MAG: GMC oxidoreductase [Pseudomonadota bacterium]
MEALEQHYGSPRLEYQFDNFRQNALMVQPVRMGEVFRGTLEDATNIDVLLNANAVEIDVDETGEQATGVQIRTLSGRASTIAASNVVVAAGGIENPRLLLSSTKVHQDGIGNANDLVGRYFADHINIEPGMLVPEDPGVDLDLYQRRNINPACETVVWHELTPETQEQHELIPASVRLMSVDDALSGPGATSLKQIKRDLSRGGMPNDLSGHVLTVLGDIEPMAGYAAKHLWYGHAPVSKVNYEMSLAPAPNRESRVYLGDETDALGMRRVVLDWKLSDVDFRTIRWAATSFADQAAANGFGRSKLELSDEYLSENVRYTWHHMCTTRMSASPGDGVVDGDCRIHGMTNLYLAGSSVFTTSGWGSPTFLIVALAQRLADHLERRLAA